jgi:molybdate transport system substrate-binding protein
LIIALLLLATAAVLRAGQPDVPALAAASDLKFAVEEIAERYRAATSRKLKLVFGSSGNFYRQIEQGAPFQIFMSADEAFIFKLADSGRAAGRGHLYATGRLVLFAPHGSSLNIDAKLSGLKTAIAAGSIRRFAIANPEHAPYGRAAEEALRNVGLWDALKPRLVLGENVSQAAQFASSGSTEGGIFAYSLALSPQISKLGRYVLIPEDWHQPLRQRMALMNGASAAARAFYDYLREPVARAVFKRYGFTLPAER